MSAAVQQSVKDLLFLDLWLSVETTPQLCGFAAVSPSDLVPHSLASFVDRKDAHIDSSLAAQGRLAALASILQQEAARHLEHMLLFRANFVLSSAAFHPVNAFALLRSTLLLLKLIQLVTSPEHTAETEPAEAALWSVLQSVCEAAREVQEQSDAPIQQQEQQLCVLLIGVVVSVQKQLFGFVDGWMDEEAWKLKENSDKRRSQLGICCSLQATLLSLYPEPVSSEIVKQGMLPYWPCYNV